MKRYGLPKLSRVAIFILQLIIVPLTLVTLAQINPQPERPITESTPVQEAEVEHNLNLV